LGEKRVDNVYAVGGQLEGGGWEISRGRGAFRTCWKKKGKQGRGAALGCKGESPGKRGKTSKFWVKCKGISIRTGAGVP